MSPKGAPCPGRHVSAAQLFGQRERREVLADRVGAEPVVEVQRAGTLEQMVAANQQLGGRLEEANMGRRVARGLHDVPGAAR